MSLVPRFAEKFIPVTESGCWLWTGYTCNKGYGIFWFDGGPRKAHRVAYEIHRGEIAEGMVIDHICRVRSCVNPDHMRVVTARENTFAGGSLAPAKKNAEKTCCPKCDGPFSKNSRGARICRPCLQKYFAARVQKRKEKALV